jgi:hypothetical protein
LANNCPSAKAGSANAAAAEKLKKQISKGKETAKVPCEKCKRTSHLTKDCHAKACPHCGSKAYHGNWDDCDGESAFFLCTIEDDKSKAGTSASAQAKPAKKAEEVKQSLSYLDTLKIDKGIQSKLKKSGFVSVGRGGIKISGSKSTANSTICSENRFRLLANDLTTKYTPQISSKQRTPVTSECEQCSLVMCTCGESEHEPLVLFALDPEDEAWYDLEDSDGA